MKKKAIFLDRDGVVNKERQDYTWKVEDFEFTDGFFEAMKIFSEMGFLFFVITNQGGIAKGLYSHKDVEILNDLMYNAFKTNNLQLTDVYYCPHHSEIEKCLCRKPDSLLIEKCIANYNIDVKKSYFIGDRQRDVDAGAKVGLNTIKIKANESLLNYIELIK
jgi:D-glycero-D-manno-heptose 1,7-bisphosphate phosphatase